MTLTGHPRTLNGTLALAALSLALLALLAGDPPPATGTIPDVRRMAFLIQNRLDHIEPGRLAAIVASGRSGYRIIDLRDSSDFDAGHVPGAEDMSLDSLVAKDFVASDTLILYSEGGIHAAQGMFLLWVRGHTAVLTLRGGMEAWRDAFPADSVEKGKGPGRRAPHAGPPRERERARDEC